MSQLHCRMCFSMWSMLHAACLKTAYTLLLPSPLIWEVGLCRIPHAHRLTEKAGAAVTQDRCCLACNHMPLFCGGLPVARLHGHTCMNPLRLDMSAVSEYLHCSAPRSSKNRKIWGRGGRLHTEIATPRPLPRETLTCLPILVQQSAGCAGVLAASMSC